MQGTLGEYRKIHPTQSNSVGIKCTHLKHLPATSVYHAYYVPHPFMSGATTVHPFHVSLLLPLHYNLQTVILPTPTSTNKHQVFSRQTTKLIVVFTYCLTI